MALVPRYLRRVMGEAILETRCIGAKQQTDSLVPLCLDRLKEDRETGFFFMTLAVPNFELAGGYEQYRSVRRNMLEAYALTFLLRYPTLKRVIGIATEPPNKGNSLGSSEDLILAARWDWTPAFLRELEERKKRFNILQEGNYAEYPVQGSEFPEVGDS